MDLQTAWFALVAVLIAGYAVLDGFDLGVGVLHLFTRSDDERDVAIAAIGPVWDGNEVWLLTGGGALFAAFPTVYATVFSGFYLALMLLLLALIARAVSLEFRGLVDAHRWRRVWDVAFGIGSLVPALLLGVAVGNVLQGLPIGAGASWHGSFLGLLGPYPLLVGLLTLAFFTAHGALWLVLKADGELAARMRRVAFGAWAVFVALWLAGTLATSAVQPSLFAKTSSPLFWLVGGLAIVAAIAMPVLLRSGHDLLAFIASATTIAALVLVTAVSAFPVLVPSSLDPAYALTAYGASSSHLTLTVMLVIALTGVPIMLGYTAFVYWQFRGKARPSAAYGVTERRRVA